MSNLINLVKSFSNKEDGQDLLEYALLVALIALIAIGAVGMAGGSVNSIFTAIAGSLAAAAYENARDGAACGVQSHAGAAPHGQGYAAQKRRSTSHGSASPPGFENRQTSRRIAPPNQSLESRPCSHQ